MTHKQKLDHVLYGLLSRIPICYSSGADYKILTFEYICSALFKDENIPEWEVRYLQHRLIEDKYIEMVEVEGTIIPIITDKGIRFIQDGGYCKEEKRKEEQDKLVKSSIESNLRSKWAIIISIISALTAIASFVFQIAI